MGGHSRIWLNPPYGREIGKWVRKAAEESAEHGIVVVCLLPARTDTTWWCDWVAPYATEVSFLRGRVRFCLNGRKLGSAPFPSALVRYGGRLPGNARQ